MRLKLDENLPESLLSGLSELNHDVDNVRQEGLTGQNDSNVWRAAQHENRFLITQDLDFSDIRQFAPGTDACPASRSRTARADSQNSRSLRQRIG
jgi:predicted nuclease of predicted toxin-antitoxin system